MRLWAGLILPNLFAIPVSLAHQDCKTVNLSLHVRIGSASSLTSSHGPPYPKEPEYVAVNLYRDFTYFDNNQGGDSQSQAQSTNNENSLKSIAGLPVEKQSLVSRELAVDSNRRVSTANG